MNSQAVQPGVGESPRRVRIFPRRVLLVLGILLLALILTVAQEERYPILDIVILPAASMVSLVLCFWPASGRNRRVALLEGLIAIAWIVAILLLTPLIHLAANLGELIAPK